MKLILMWIFSILISLVSNRGNDLVKRSNHKCKEKRIPCFDESVPDQISTSEGKTIVLQCYIYNANFSDTIISWWKEGTMRELTLGETSHLPRHRLLRSFHQDWSLEIIDARLTDSGLYICQINLIDLMEKFYRVDVTSTKTHKIPEQYYVKDEGVKVKIKNSVSISGNSKGVSGEPISLSCTVHFTDTFTDASIQWFHNNNRQYTTEDQGIEISLRWERNNTAYSVLTISNLNPYHSGIWRCVKITDVQIEPKESAEMNLTVTDSLQILRKTLQLKAVKSNSCFVLIPNKFILITGLILRMTEILSMFLVL